MSIPSGLVSTSELAELCGYTPRTINNWAKQGVITPIPRVGRKGNDYDLVPTLSAILEFMSEKSGSDELYSAELGAAKMRQLRARTEMDELKLGLMRGELHHSDDIRRVFEPMLIRLRTNLLGLGMSVAPAIAGTSDVNGIAGIIREHLERAISELSNYDFKDFKQHANVEN